jgi:protoporphyrinogen oxidase
LWKGISMPKKDDENENGVQSVVQEIEKNILIKHMQKRKVIIAGGGLAGLSAAYELIQTGDFDIHLIEKNAYLGGRVHTCIVNGQVMDVGGFLIYPWYKHYHHLIETLGLTKELVKIPPAGEYYAYKHNLQEEYNKGFTLSFREIVEIFIEIFPIPLTDSDPTYPELHVYHDLTIHEFITRLYLPAIKKDFYLSVFDTYLQGYCYGPVTEVKMAFMAATIFQNTRHGDLHSASYLKNGSQVFIDALQHALETNGVKIHLNCMLESTGGKQFTTSSGIMQADDIIFCHTPDEVKYSRFITATILYSGTALINDDADWGSCFYKEDAQKKFAILSVVNVEKLYNKKAAQYLNLNIKVNDHTLAPISSNELLEIIIRELPTHFKDIKVLEIANRVDWEKAMPIASESFVGSIRMKQGKDNFYYAGDFMGCPAMETALMSGRRAAQQLINATISQ